MDELEAYLDAHWKQVSVVVIVRAKATLWRLALPVVTKAGANLRSR